MSGRQTPRRTTLHVFGAAAARREPPCVRPARARCRARWHAATQARGACPAGADRGAHGATRPEGAWRTDLDVACPLLALHRTATRRCLAGKNRRVFKNLCNLPTFFCFEESRQSFSHFSKVCSKLTHRNALPLDEACKVQLVQGLPSTGRKATSIASHLSAASDVDTGRA